jgi:SH3-like domain-containing protein
MANIDRIGNKIFTACVMKTNLWWILSAFIVAGMPATDFGEPAPAVVKGETVNVRGQPSIFSEVITQLKKGEKVVVLEEIVLKKPKPDDSPKWARIQMPANTPVWVAASFIDTNTSTVKPPKLNVRAGPGENYSVVGLLKKDEAVKSIRVQNTWMEIECPTNAYAFIASELLGPASPEAVAAPAPAEKPAEKPVEKPALLPVVTNAPPAIPAVPPAETPPPTTEQPKPEPEKVTSNESAPPPFPAPSTVVTSAPPTLPPALVAPPPITPPPVAAPLPKVEEPRPKRIVYREGIVRAVRSIQAPTNYELASPETGKTIDYLQPASTNIVLKPLIFKRIQVSGQEYMDSNWPSTPILKVDTLKLAPDAAR